MSQNPEKPYELRKITRIDIKGRKSHNKGTHGWQVRFQSPSDKSKDINQFFNDSKFGGKEKALEAAKHFRDAMEIEYDPEHPGSLNTMRKTRNKSGFIGVHRTKRISRKKYGTYIYDVWQAHYPIEKNKHRSRAFSISKHGEEGALKLAIEWREEGIKKYKATFDKLFEPPSNINVKIWRYLDFTKFASLLVNKGLFFPRADKFNDQFEGSFSFANKKLRPLIYKTLKRNYTSEEFSKYIRTLRKKVFISCWHLSEFESAGMWSLYSKTEEAICIQSTYSKMREIFDENINIGMVRYVDYEKEWIPENNILAPFLYKRQSFEHEHEIRAIINKSNSKKFLDIKNSDENLPDGIWVNLNLNKLIEKVYVAPNSSNWFYELVQNVVAVYKLNVPVLRSSLEEEPFY